MLCCRCWRLSPPGSVYCSQCEGKRSFNGVICGGGHRCQVGTVTCPTCGSDEFSEHTTGMPVSWLAKPLTCFLLVCIWKLALAYHTTLFPVLWGGTADVFGFLTNSDSYALENLLRTMGAWGLVLWMIGLGMNVLPSKGWALGRFLRSLPVRIYQLIVRWVPRLLILLWRGVIKLVGGKASKSTPSPNRTNDKTGKGE